MHEGLQQNLWCLQSAEHLQAELEAQKQAIDTLKEELARIESDKARELEETIARCGVAVGTNGHACQGIW